MTHRPDRRPDPLDAGLDRGFTLIEVIVASALLSGVVALSFGVIVQMERFWVGQDARAERIANAEMAVWNIDKYARSANVMYEPHTDPTTGDTYFKIYTQANADPRCVEWRVTSAGELQTRRWAPEWPINHDVTGWRTITGGILNYDARDSLAPFSVSQSGSAYGARLLTIRLEFAGATGVTTADGGGPTVITTSFAGRNTQAAYNASVCSPNPA